MVKNRLATNLQALMRAHNTTPTALARATGIGQPVIHRMATGETDNPTLGTLKPIAKYFGITMNQLIGEDPLEDNYLRHQITMIPLIDIAHASKWNRAPQEVKPSRHIMIDTNISAKGFAVRLEDSTMEPTFPAGTTVIIDPLLKATNGNFVIAYHQGKRLSTFKQLLIDGQDFYLKALNPAFETIKATETHVIIGPMIQARLDFK